MTELRLVGLHDDSERLVLQSSDGAQFTVVIDDALRAAVRRDRPRMEHHRAQSMSRLSPREIQSRIRAGGSVSAIAEEAGVEITQISRYEGPVIAERVFIAGKAQTAHVGRVNDSPQLGELVTDRLAARGISTDGLAWDAFKVASDPWTVQVTYQEDAAEKTATWSYDLGSKQVSALDDAARLLTETAVADEPIPLNPRLRSLHADRAETEPAAASVTELFDVEEHGNLEDPADLPDAAADPSAATNTLLDDLQTRRGIRQYVPEPADDDDLDDDDLFDGFGPTNSRFHAGSGAASGTEETAPAQPDASPMRVLPFGAQTTDSTPVPAVDPQETAPLPDPAQLEDSPEVPEPLAKTPKPSRRARSQVPSWDEIVFGTKQDDS